MSVEYGIFPLLELEIFERPPFKKNREKCCKIFFYFAWYFLVLWKISAYLVKLIMLQKLFLEKIMAATGKTGRSDQVAKVIILV